MTQKTPIRALIVDDEPLARRGLKLRLSEHPQIEVIGEAANGRQALEFIAEQSPDVVFLDIEMPGLNGFDVVAGIQSDAMPQIIFVTAFNQYAVEAFDIHALDYVLKPVDPARLAESIERLGQRLLTEAVSDKGALLAALDKQPAAPVSEANQYPEKLAIKDRGEITLVPVEKIDWVDAAGDYMCIHESGNTHVQRMTMKQLEKQLNPEQFTRVHRSSIVNVSRVEKIHNHANSEYYLEITGGHKLKMSRSYKDTIKRFIAG